MSHMTIKKLSISVDERTDLAARALVESGKYRSLSHLFEDGVKRILDEEGLV